MSSEGGPRSARSRRPDFNRFDSLVSTVRDRGHRVLLEPEALGALESIGIPVPRWHYCRDTQELRQLDLDRLECSQVVVKVVSHLIAHKTDVGGIRLASPQVEPVRAAMREIEQGLEGVDAEGFTLHQYVDYRRGLGREWLVSLRWNREYGPLLTLSPGGLEAETLHRVLKPENALGVASPDLTGDLRSAFAEVAALDLAISRHRSQDPLIAESEFFGFFSTLLELAPAVLKELDEIEMNPVVVHDSGLVALDVLATRRTGSRLGARGTPTDKIHRLLHPRSMVFVGVSRQPNPGRLMLENTLAAGFPPERIRVVKPSQESILGCRCVPTIAELQGRVDLLVVGLSAAGLPGVFEDLAAHGDVESVVIIAGGLEEMSGGEGVVSQIESVIDSTRRTPWRGPVVNGGNCFGIRSREGRYDTFFVPGYKIPAMSTEPSGAVLISQSGAVLASRSSKFDRLGFDYAISVGNQLDLTAGDYLEYFSQRDATRLVAAYVEGFKPGDGLKFLRAAQRIRSRGGRVILYRAGRTSEGSEAAASHTAAVAGSYEISRELSGSSGVIMADTLEEFEDLVDLAWRLGERELPGRRLAALSNAGFECVAIADSLLGFRLAEFGPETQGGLQELLDAHGLGAVVEVRNPMDLTPLLDDAAYDRAVTLLLADPGVDTAIIGCVPLTGSLDTLSAEPRRHPENLFRQGSVGDALRRIWRDTRKPWIVVIDAGARYDDLANYLAEAGIPVFRTADRALRALSLLL